MSDPADLHRRKAMHAKQRELFQLKAKEHEVLGCIAQNELDLRTHEAELEKVTIQMAKTQAELDKLGQ